MDYSAAALREVLGDANEDEKFALSQDVPRWRYALVQISEGLSAELKSMRSQGGTLAAQQRAALMSRKAAVDARILETTTKIRQLASQAHSSEYKALVVALNTLSKRIEVLVDYLVKSP